MLCLWATMVTHSSHSNVNISLGEVVVYNSIECHGNIQNISQYTLYTILL